MCYVEGRTIFLKRFQRTLTQRNLHGSYNLCGISKDLYPVLRRDFLFRVLRSYAVNAFAAVFSVTE